MQTTVRVILLHEGKVLVQKHLSADSIEVPGDRILPFERAQETAVRALKEVGLDIEPQNILFVSEDVRPDADIHEVAIFAYAQVTGGEINPLTGVMWIDVRELGNHQDAMTDMTIDAFFKFSTILRAKAQKGE